MAHCPCCLSVISKSELVCHSCGAEKGYVYVRRKARGLVFLVASGLLLPWLLVLASLVVFRGVGIPLLATAGLALGLGGLTIYKLVTGPVWYR